MSQADSGGTEEFDYLHAGSPLPPWLSRLLDPHLSQPQAAVGSSRHLTFIIIILTYLDILHITSWVSSGIVFPLTFSSGTSALVPRRSKE